MRALFDESIPRETSSEALLVIQPRPRCLYLPYLYYAEEMILTSKLSPSSLRDETNVWMFHGCLFSPSGSRHYINSSDLVEEEKYSLAFVSYSTYALQP